MVCGIRLYRSMNSGEKPSCLGIAGFLRKVCEYRLYYVRMGSNLLR